MAKCNQLIPLPFKGLNAMDVGYTRVRAYHLRHHSKWYFWTV